MASKLPFLAVLAVFSGFWASCTGPVVPARISAAAAISGVLASNPDGSAIISELLRERYDALIQVYGKKKLPDGAPVFIPALVKDAGLTHLANGSWGIDAEHVRDFAVLAGFQRRGEAP